MIESLKKLKGNLLLFLAGVAGCFAQLYTILNASSTISYMMGMSYASVCIVAVILFALVSALLYKLLCYILFRVCGAIFTKKSGMLYPFSLTYQDFVKSFLVFNIFSSLVSGAVLLPAIFIGTLVYVLSAVSQVVVGVFYVLTVRYMVNVYGHDYDRGTLAFSLSVLLIVLYSLTAIYAIFGVVLL